MPTLRERREEIAILARHFIATSEADAERGVTGIFPEAQSMLSNYAWPGNVRQLKHVIELAMAFASGPIIQPHDLALRPDCAWPPQTA